MPDPAGLEVIAHELRERSADSIVDTLYYRDSATLIVNPDRVIEVLTWLREDPTQQYGFLSSLHGADYLPHTPRFGIHYELHDVASGRWIAEWGPTIGPDNRPLENQKLPAWASAPRPLATGPG